jgi:hypothetical protein
MLQVLCRSAGRATLIFGLTGMVGSVTGPAAPASAATPSARHAVRIGTAVAYVREPDGSIREIR